MTSLYYDVWGRPPGYAHQKLVREFDEEHWQAAEKLRLRLERKGWDCCEVIEVEYDDDDEDDEDSDDDEEEEPCYHHEKEDE